MLAKRGALLAVGFLALVPFSPAGLRTTRFVGMRGSADPTALVFLPTQKEFYMSDDEIAFIRPGLNVTVNSITNVGPGQKPVVDISLADDLGQPLDRNGVLTPGAVGAEFILARYNADTRAYFNYTAIAFGPGAPPTPLHDVGGTWQDPAVGHSIYTFGLSMPAGFDVTQTATLGIYAARDLQDFIGKSYDAPAVVQYFRPDGGVPSNVQFDALDISACNTCHNPLSMHGQFGPPVQDVKLCVMCHTLEMPPTASGESLVFNVFIHKLHRGQDLPSVQAGTPYVLGAGNDFSTVEFPQDIRNCQTCHSNVAAGYTNYFTYPSRAACGSCHDDVNFATGENHPGGVQVDDSNCATCHVPQGGREWDASVVGAHTVPFKSTQLKGLNAAIVSVTNTAPGQHPTVVFQITNGDGSAVDPSTLGEAFLVLSGPTTDYGTTPFSLFETITTATFDGQKSTLTAMNAIPANATGSWGVAISALRSVTLNPAPSAGPAAVSEAALNPVVYVAVTDAQPVARRVVVDRANCNKCHDNLALHGGNFQNTAMCVMCHNPNGDDSSQRPAAQNPPESIDFKRFIHRIHTGENLTQDFTIYGFRGSVNNFNGVRFPGDRRDCEKCHVPGAEEVLENPPDGLLPTTTARDWFSPQQHYTAACLGCHDTKAAAAHAYVNTAPFGEACAACHAADDEFAVDKVHAH